MPALLVALDEGSNILLDRAMLVVGRHPQCDARLDSIRVSRRHCCMTPDNGEVVVRDLGSTNGIRINGQRVEMGRLKPGDELSIAHIRYRLEDGQAHEVTMAESLGGHLSRADGHNIPYPIRSMPSKAGHGDGNALAAAVRDMLPSAIADKCRIQVIVQMQPESVAAAPAEGEAQPCRPDSSP